MSSYDIEKLLSARNISTVFAGSYLYQKSPELTPVSISSLKLNSSALNPSIQFFVYNEAFGKDNHLLEAYNVFVANDSQFEDVLGMNVYHITKGDEIVPPFFSPTFKFYAFSEEKVREDPSLSEYLMNGMLVPVTLYTVTLADGTEVLSKVDNENQDSIYSTRFYTPCQISFMKV